MQIKPLVILLFWLFGAGLNAQTLTATKTSTLDSLPSWYWNTKISGHLVLHHTFFFCGLHHYDGDGTPDKDCPAGINCNDCYLSRVYSDYFQQIGAKVITRTIKAAQDKPVWCSAIGGLYDGKDPISGAKNGLDFTALSQSNPGDCDTLNIPKALMQAAEEKGIKQLFYYRASADDDLSQQFPEWRAKNIDGQDLKFAGSKSDYLCVNSPYGNALNTRFQELVASGLNGLYLDNYHNPNTGCWCDSCKRKYSSLMGGTIPQQANDTLVTQYYNKIIYKHIDRIQNTLHSTDNGTDDPTILIGSVGRFLMLNQRGINKKFVRLLDVPKAEYSHPVRMFANKYFYSKSSVNSLTDYRIPNSVRLGFAWSILRDYSHHRTFSAWIEPEVRHNQEKNSFFNVPIPKDQLTSYLGAAYAFGFKIDPVLHVNSRADVKADPDLLLGGVPNQQILNDYRSVFEIDNKVAPFIGAKKPVKWNAVLFDIDLKDRYLKNIVGADGVTYRDEMIDQDGFWMDYLLPSHAAFELLKNYKRSDSLGDWSIKQPVYILDHDDFLNGRNTEGIVNIVVPNKSLLSQQLLNALQNFDSTEDKCVIYLKDEPYYQKGNTQGQQEFLYPAYGKLFESEQRKAPIYAVGNQKAADQVFVEFYENPEGVSDSDYNFIVALTNNISWSVPVSVRRTYAQTKVLDFFDHPDEITKLELVPPSKLPAGALSIRISPGISTELTSLEGDVLINKLHVVDLQTGENLDHLVFYNADLDEFLIEVPAFEMISVLGIYIREE